MLSVSIGFMQWDRAYWAAVISCAVKPALFARDVSPSKGQSASRSGHYWNRRGPLPGETSLIISKRLKSCIMTILIEFYVIKAISVQWLRKLNRKLNGLSQKGSLKAVSVSSLTSSSPKATTFMCLLSVIVNDMTWSLSLDSLGLDAVYWLPVGVGEDLVVFILPTLSSASLILLL